MRKILLIGLLGIIFPSLSYGQASVIRNDTPTTLYGTNLQAGSSVAVDQYGQGKIGSIVPGTSATSLGKAEDAAHVTGDTGVMSLGVRNDSIAALSGANGDYTPIGVLSSGAVISSMQSVWTGGAFQLAAFPEDSASTDGDTVWLQGCRANTSGTTVTIGTDGDYGVPACTTTGALQVVGIGQALGKSAFRLEDDVWTSGDAMIVVGGQNESAMTVAQSAANDVANLKLDLTGRLMTGPAPHGEFWQSCGTATASTSDVAIKAAVASNRIYVTSLVCKNTSAATATSLDFKDATTVIAVGGISQMATTAPGSFSASFPTPLRGTSNTAFNFATNVSVSSVTCCGAGFISVD